MHIRTMTSRRSPIIGTIWARTRMGATAAPIPPAGAMRTRGAMIYLGGAWPAEYDGSLFMNNIHGGANQPRHPHCQRLGLSSGRMPPTSSLPTMFGRRSSASSTGRTVVFS